MKKENLALLLCLDTFDPRCFLESPFPKVALNVGSAIYDVREHLFDYATDLDNVDMVLPKYEQEIPAGSFAVVTYPFYL